MIAADPRCACGDVLFLPESQRTGQCISCRERQRGADVLARLKRWEDDAIARNSAAHEECRLILGACRRLDEEVHA